MSTLQVDVHIYLHILTSSCLKPLQFTPVSVTPAAVSPACDAFHYLISSLLVAHGVNLRVLLVLQVPWIVFVTS